MKSRYEKPSITSLWEGTINCSSPPPLSCHRPTKQKIVTFSIVFATNFLSWATPHTAINKCRDLATDTLRQPASIHNPLHLYAHEHEIDSFLLEQLELKFQAMHRGFTKEQVENILLFLKNLREGEQIPFIRHLDEIDMIRPHNRSVRKFIKLQREIAEQESQYFTSKLEEIKQKMDIHEIQDEDIKRVAWQDTQDFIQRYRLLKYECSANKWNPTQKEAASRFRSFMVGMGITTSFISMGLNNKDRAHSEWGSQFFYELLMGTARSYLKARIFSTPSWSYLHRGLLDYGVGRAFGILDGLIFHHFLNMEIMYGDDKSETLKEFEEKLKKGEIPEELISTLNDTEGFLEHFRAKIIQSANHILQLVGLSSKSPDIIEKIRQGSLSESDLADEGVKAALAAAVAEVLYDRVKGNWIVTGNTAVDRFFFSASYAAFNIPLQMAVGFYIYRKICMGFMIKKENIKALTTFVIKKIITDPFYYATRRHSIGI